MAKDKDAPDSKIFDEFIEDFFAESEEHLTAVQSSLLSLEAFVHKFSLDTSLIKDLLLHFHSLKGLSAMVSLTESERLSHKIESYLKMLIDGKIVLNTEAMDSIIAGTNLLEEIISARRKNEEIPSIELIMGKFDMILAENKEHPASEPLVSEKPPVTEAPCVPEKPAAEKIIIENSILTDAEKDKIKEMLTEGKKVWHFVFTPSPSLAERGVGVNSVRERLRTYGELIHASPRVTEGGGISFDFILVSKEDEALFEPWLKDGITFRQYMEAPEVKTPADKPAEETHQILSASQGISTSGFVRVDLSRLDDLMRMIGDLVISRARLQDRISSLIGALPVHEMRPLQEINLAIERQLRELREGVMRVRLVPVGEIFQRMRFVVRDLARETNKKVLLQIEGEETEIDKFVVERMMDPLLHLVRNAVSHGLESESERLAAGKSSEGRLTLKASTSGNTVMISIEDDGRGIDIEKVIEKAKSLNLLDMDTGIDQNMLLGILCSPGFSTRDEADRASGRGVGMTVVKNAVTELGGSIKLESKKNTGTRFTIQLPLTLAIIDALIVMAGGQIFAVPQVSVSEVLEVLPSDITELENNELVPYRDGVLPLARLSNIFGIGEVKSRSCYALVAGEGSAMAGIVVDRLLGQREIVVRAITEKLIQIPGIAGATELGDGKAVLILDVNVLAKIDRKKIVRMRRQ